jgi:hypothetical protein
MRVFYEPEIGEDAKKIIKILAVGRKEANKLFIGEEVIKL